MNDTTNPYASWGTIAAHAETSERAQFIRRTYMHLAAAVALFVGLEALLLNSSLAEPMTRTMLGGRWSWLIVMVAFVGVSWLADAWARSAVSKGMQYAGLILYVVAQSVIFVPLLYIAQNVGENVLPISAFLTLFIFAGLTGIVFMTGADFSFLRAGLGLAGLVAMALIVCSILFGFQLGILFFVVMIAFAGAYILYDTSNVLHHYRTDQYVAASLALFASVALMLWYVVQLVMSLTSRD